jgi:hypothetical protein
MTKRHHSSSLDFVAFSIGVLLVSAIAFAQRSTPTQLVQPGAAASDSFGNAVAVDGDTMVIGAPTDDIGSATDRGSVYVYRWIGTGWSLEATLLASDGAAGDQFGNSVAISANSIVVGAFGDDIGSNSNQGSAYVFVRSGTSWSQQAKLTVATGSANDQLGFDVAIAGNTVLLGAYQDDVGTNSNQGTAFVFVRSGSTWSQQAQLNANDGSANDQFGHSVALLEDTALVGAWNDDVGANANQGSAYVFVRSGVAWTQQAQLTAANGAADDLFSSSVALGPDVAVVGARSDDISTNTNQGSVSVFVRSGATWSQQTQLVATDGAANDRFGYSVAFEGDTIVVGADGDDLGSTSDQGSAYVYVRDQSGWRQQAKLEARDGATGDFLGVAVAIFGDTAIIGANRDDAAGIIDSGSAWVFSRFGGTWLDDDLQLLAFDGTAGDNFGSAVAIEGDTLVVGASLEDILGDPDRGAAYVFVRAGSSWIHQAKLTASDGGVGDQFGTSVAIQGDTIIVGAHLDDVVASPDHGSAYVFVRVGTTWSQQAKMTASDGMPGDLFGSATAIFGDTAVIGAYSDDIASNPGQGSAYVFVRSGSSWSLQTKLTAVDGGAFERFGRSVAMTQDAIVVGADFDDIGTNLSQGSAYVFRYSGTSWYQEAKLLASNGRGGDLFGGSVAMSGESIIVGARGASRTQGLGAAYVFTRSIYGVWQEEAELGSQNGLSSDEFGYSVGLSGNLAIVGAPTDTVGGTASQGSAHAFVRTGTTWMRMPMLTLAGGAANDYFGWAVAVSGDTIAVSALLDDVGSNADQGSIMVFERPAGDFAVANNDSTGMAFTSLSSALVTAQSGHQITSSEAAFWDIISLSTVGRSISIRSSGDIRSTSASTIDLGGSSILAAPADARVEIHGNLRSSSLASVDIEAGTFSLGSRGVMTARSGSSLTIRALTTRLDGQTRLEQAASLTILGNATAYGPTTCTFNAAITTEGVFTNADAFTLSSGSVSTPLLWNQLQLNVFGTSAVFGSYTNDVGATTTVRSGTLFVFGSLTNLGTIVGSICSNCLGSPPNLDVGGSLSLGSSSYLLMPFDESVIRVGGHFDCAIDSSARFDMSLASIELQGAGGEQLLEVMSVDLGPSALGLDRTITGHFPIKHISVGPAPSTVRLLDTHDNDNFGQSSSEAIYVDTLIIHAGSRLINTSCRVYYNTLINNGTVDLPGNLVQIGTPLCVADLDDGSFTGTPDGGVTIDDLLYYLFVFEQGDLSADVDDGSFTGTPDGGVTIDDLLYFLQRFEQGC